MTESSVVTVLFTDIVKSVELKSRLGDAASDELRRRHFLAEVLADLRRERLVERVLLRGLPEDERPGPGASHTRSEAELPASTAKDESPGMRSPPPGRVHR